MPAGSATTSATAATPRAVEGQLAVAEAVVKAETAGRAAREARAVSVGEEDEDEVEEEDEEDEEDEEEDEEEQGAAELEMARGMKASRACN